MAVLGREVRISGVGEDIWVAVLRREVRISGVIEDICEAVLGQEVRISGVEVVGIGCGCLGGSLKARGEDAIKGLRPHICSPLGCWNLGGQGSTVSKHKNIMKNAMRFLWK